MKKKIVIQNACCRTKLVAEMHSTGNALVKSEIELQVNQQMENSSFIVLKEANSLGEQLDSNSISEE
jgi:hypothetical protein